MVSYTIIIRVFFHLGKHQTEDFFFSLEAIKGELQLHSGDFCMNRELLRGLLKTKTIMHHCRAEQAPSPASFREFCLSCEDGDLSKTVITDAMKH